MSLIYKVADLIESGKKREVESIGHGCNCFCTMGSGIAPQIKKAFPEAFMADLATEKGDKHKLGTYSYATTADKSLTIFNIYSQYGYWGRNNGIMDFNYEAFDEASWQVLNHMKARGIESIGLPLIGAGLAGGDWSTIEAIINKNLANYLDVVIHVLDKKYIP